MKTYMGVPGETPLVTVTDTATGKTLPLGGSHGWGKSVDAGNTALRILVDHLGDEAQARTLHRRFMHRALVPLRADQPWTLMGAQVAIMLQEITANAADIAKVQDAVAHEVMPVADERGPGLSEIKQKM